MPSAQISHADSSSPWLTECPGNTGLLTNSSFLKASHIHCLRYVYLHLHLWPPHMHWRIFRSDVKHISFHLGNCLRRRSGFVVSDVKNHQVNQSRQKMPLESGFCLNHAAPKSYFHYNGSILLRAWCGMNSDPRFVGANWWYSKGLTWLSQWSNTSIPDRPPFWSQTLDSGVRGESRNSQGRGVSCGSPVYSWVKHVNAVCACTSDIFRLLTFLHVGLLDKSAESKQELWACLKLIFLGLCHQKSATGLPRCHFIY